MWLCLDCHAVWLTPLASAAARILGPPGAPTVGAVLPPPGAAKRTGRTAPGRGVAAALPPGVTRPEHARGHPLRTSPAGLVHSQQRGRRIPRQREAGTDQTRADQDSQDGRRPQTWPQPAAIGPD